MTDDQRKVFPNPGDDESAQTLQQNIPEAVSGKTPAASTQPPGSNTGAVTNVLRTKGTQGQSGTAGQRAVAADENLTSLGERYSIIRLLGRGGMGSVYHARDNELDRDVALKIIRPEVAGDATMLERFKREIQLSSTITHRNVLRVYDLGEADGARFLTMQFVQGENLAELMRREGTLPLSRVIALFRQICEGLAAAHEHGILHRDLKPDNVMLDAQDRVLLTDFGIAKSLSQGTLTEVGQIMGTPRYMSPEQVKGEKVDQRSDIFSMGILLYEMVTGVVPFGGNTVFEIMIQRTQRAARPAIELMPDLPPYLDSIIRRCLATDRNSRYASVPELLRDLDHGMGTGKTARSSKFLMRRLKSIGGSRKWQVSVAIVLLLGIAAGSYMLWGPKLTVVPGGSAGLAQRAPISILISDFENTTGDSVLSNTLEDLLGSNLEGASFITAFNRGRARQIAGQIQPGAKTLDDTTTRLVAQREGIGVILSGAVVPKGSSITVTVRTMDSLTGQPLAAESINVAARNELAGAMAEMATRIRRALGDAVPESAGLAAAETFTTASLEAAHNYALAQELQGRGSWKEAIPFYRAAIEIDPQLGRAHAGLAVMYRNMGQREQAEKYYQEAMARVDRMSERERFRTRGGYFVTVGNQPKAIEEFNALVSQYAADFVGHSNLALAYFLMRNMSQAQQEGRKALQIYPRNVVMRTNLALYAMYAGDFASAEAEAAEVLKTGSKYESLFVAQALSQLALGKGAEALAAYQALQQVGAAGASTAAMGRADMALYNGKTSEALGLLEKGIATDKAASDAASAERKESVLAQALLDLGRTQEALRRADQLSAATKQLPVLFEMARLYARGGAEAKALKIAGTLAAGLESEPNILAKLVQAEAQLKKGTAIEAVKTLLEAQKLGDTWLARMQLGRAYLDAGLFTEAQSEFDRCIKRQGEAAAVFLDDIPTLHYLPVVFYYAGRAQEGLGSRAGAADHYRKFIAIREGAETDKLASDARRRLAALQ